MLDQVLELFNIQPDLDLNVMQDGQTPTQVAARVLQQLEPHLSRARPDWILVQGDTTTVMATALAAHHLQIKIGHIEAGLRTHDKRNPFPEEMNRVVADALSDLHFAPTQRARENLLREGISDTTIRVTGNTVIDALHWIAQQPLPPSLPVPLSPLLLRSPSPRLLLVTAHRRENFGQPLRNICAALREIATTRPDVRIVYPVHLNPNVQQPVNELLRDLPNVTLLPPVDYLTLAHLLKHCYLVLTDSGGLQEEAPSLGKPVLVLRETTERPEAIEAGTAKIVGTDRAVIVRETYRLLDDAEAYAAMARAVNPFGDGHAAERIVDALSASFH
ncbi:MAG: UDP-N-acetylglucosamine 2-epimerase (non-hydrolyzing) [Chloroflexi bacterium]|nr:UDP-N-acetylglucosamine 2-epimerase (non-hydrolyzing) [Chloroflexota bacterium]